METDKEDQLRIEVVKGAKAIFSKGLVEVGEGNVSIRIPKKDEFFITPSFNQYDTLTKEEVVKMKFDGTPLSSGKLPSTEYRLHVAIYESRPKANCVIHTHSPYATMLSIVRKRIPVIMEEQVIFLGGSVEVSEFGKAHTDEVGIKALEAMGIKNGVLLANHGTLVSGKSLGQAVKLAELLEKLARIYWGALQIGEPAVIPEEACERFQKDYDVLFATYAKGRKKR
jgi:L-fuculose-phosphate aldolase